VQYIIHVIDEGGGGLFGCQFRNKNSLSSSKVSFERLTNFFFRFLSEL